MELAQIAQLAGAFLGGGLAKTLLDHVLSDRTARRSELRPIDRTRINALRTLSETVLAFHHEYPPPRSHKQNFELLGKCRSTMIELADEKLEKFWNAFEDSVYSYPMDRIRTTTEDEELALDASLEVLHERVMKRLNELERRR